jgi:ABC-2 type transport system ATP-binding protein
LGNAITSRIDSVLETVGLADRQRDRVKSYSLGMKQRLGLAIALLNDPDLLILDEPANGLDPAGVVEMRDLLRNLAAQGKTIFISSHVLSEVQQICVRVAIINLGELVKVASVEELITSHGEFTVDVEDAPIVLELIRRQDWGRTARLVEGAIVCASPTGRGRDLTRFLVAAGHFPDAIGERHQDLEDIFLSLTGAA